MKLFLQIAAIFVVVANVEASQLTQSITTTSLAEMRGRANAIIGAAKKTTSMNDIKCS